MVLVKHIHLLRKIALCVNQFSPEPVAEFFCERCPLVLDICDELPGTRLCIHGLIVGLAQHRKHQRRTVLAIPPHRAVALALPLVASIAHLRIIHPRVPADPGAPADAALIRLQIEYATCAEKVLAAFARLLIKGGDPSFCRIELGSIKRHLGRGGWTVSPHAASATEVYSLGSKVPCF